MGVMAGKCCCSASEKKSKDQTIIKSIEADKSRMSTIDDAPTTLAVDY
jgi:hypothetical protein